jgi:hypothetical protein
MNKLSSFFIILFLLKIMSVSGQTFSSDNRNSWKASYGLFYPLTSKYKNPISTSFQNAFNTPKQSVGIALEHARGYGKVNVCGELGINYFYNQIIHIGDSIKLNWFGNNMYFILKYDLFPKNKYIDLFICGGALIGSQRIIITDKSSEVYRNFNAALIPQLELRIQTIKRISLGVEANFIYDLTDPKWKRNGTENYLLDKSSFSGTQMKFFIGWCWGK